MKLHQHVDLDEISHNFESGSCWVKNWVTRSNVRKLIFSPIIIKLDQHVVGLDEIWNKFESGSCPVKN